MTILNKLQIAVFATTVVLFYPAASFADILASADFSSYSSGNLVGQNGWLQYNTQSTIPLQVVGGRVGWAGNGLTAANNQDAMLAFASVVAQPTTGTTILNFDMVLSIASAGATPSYFAALNQLNTNVTASNFQNARLVARSSGSGFVFGARVNGQGGYPFAYGTSVLNFNQDYALRAEINMIAGNANDFINLYVGPDFNNLTLHATAAYTTGTVSDPTFGAMLISQFASATAFESGVSIRSMSVTAVPEPASAGLLALTGIAGLAFRRRRM
jgi:hypothetical protein